MAVETVRLGPFLPDQPVHRSPGSQLIRNALPIRTGYEPARQISPVTEALLSPALSARFVRTPDGNVFGFVGTADGISRLSGQSFTEVSRPGGYTTADGNVWRWTKFGSNLFATNFDDQLQRFDLESSTQYENVFDDVETALHAKFIAPVGTFLALGYTQQGGTVKESGVRWSSNNQPTNFPELASDDAIQTLSDEQVLPTDYGEITGLVAGLTGSQAVVFQERAVQKMNFTRGRAIFEFDLVEGARGCTAPNSIVQVGGDVYYLDDTGVFLTDGQRSIGIGESQVDAFIYDRIDTARLAEVRSGFDVRKKLIYWSIPTRGGDSLILVHNFEIREWGFIEGLTVQCFFRQLSTGITLEDLDNISGSLDSLPASLDSDLWKGGGLPVFAAFDENNRLGPLEGLTLAATMLTAEIEPIPDKRAFWNFTRPLIDTTQVTITPFHRERTQDLPTTGRPIALAADGRAVHRLNARYAALQMDVEAGAEWTSTQGLQLVIEPSGTRQPTPATVGANDGAVILTDTGIRVTTEAGRTCLHELPPPIIVIDNLVTSDGDQLVTSEGDDLILSLAA